MRRSDPGLNPSDAVAPADTDQSRIECHADLSAFFHDALTRALTSRKVEAPDSTAFYLVGLLATLGHDAASFSRSLVDLSFDLTSTSRVERLARLRAVGDQALSVTGLFDAHLERRGISRTYLRDLGSRAYRSACELASHSHQRGERTRAEVFFDLGEHFGTYAAVLEDVRETTMLGTPDDVLSLYERFQKTRSPALAERLLARGVVPIDGSGEVC